MGLSTAGLEKELVECLKVATLETICERLRENDLALVELKLGCKGPGEGAGQAIGQALALNTTLTRLDHAYNGLGEGRGRAIGHALAFNTTLTRLNLGDNDLRERVGRAMGQALALNTALTRLAGVKSHASVTCFRHRPSLLTAPSSPSPPSD